jgi:hypothetical protein
MKTNIYPRDWELLSEYVDGQLSSKKQGRLEARLQQEPDLRTALEDLRRTKMILRSVPRLKAPRNFTLKPSMVPQPKTRRIYPIFQLATAVASLMLVIVLAGDMLGFTPGFGSPGASVDHPSQALLMEEAIPEEPSLSMAAPEDAAQPSERQMVEPEAAPPGIMVFATPEVESLPGEAPELAEEAPHAPGEVPVTPEGPTVAGEFMPVPKQVEAEAFRSGDEANMASQAEAELTSDEGFWTQLRITQLGLALVALASAVTAIYLKRKGV